MDALDQLIALFCFGISALEIGRTSAQARKGSLLSLS